VVIRKRSEHGLGHLLNPLDPDSDDRDWIDWAWDVVVNAPKLLWAGGDAPWLELPALTRVALTTKEVARAFDSYNEGKALPEQVWPFNFLLHAHHSFASQPMGADAAHFRLVAPYESDPGLWLSLPWVDLATGERHEVTTVGIPRPGVVLLKTYREVLARYAMHPEPKSFDPDGNPCTRSSPPGLLSRRRVTMLTLSLIGKESNRLDEIAVGLIGTLDDTLASYGDPGLKVWNELVVPAMTGFPSREVAGRAGLDPRTVQRIKRQAISKSHDRNRAVLTLVTAELVGEEIQRWGEDPPSDPLARIAYYVDHRDKYRPVALCAVCGAKLASRRQRYCGEACRKKAYRGASRRKTSRASVAAKAGLSFTLPTASHRLRAVTVPARTPPRDVA
jgi:hypothetical protein